MGQGFFEAPVVRRPRDAGGTRKGRTVGPTSLKVTASGALALYGLSRFPVTLDKRQWGQLLSMADDIRAFIAANEGQLAPGD